MIYGYIRVSTDKQDTQNQKFEITKFAKANNLVINEWIAETISSKAVMEKRQLGKLLKKMKKEDMMIASEISRIGRNLMQIMSVLHDCMNRDIMVWTIKDNFRLGNDIQSKVLAFAFGLSAEIERNLISQRTKEALARKKASGQILGRPMGSSNGVLKLSGKEKQIQELLNRKVSYSAIGRILGAHRLTVSTFCEEKGLVSKRKKNSNVKSSSTINKRNIDYEIIKELYSSGVSFSAIAKQLSWSGSALKNRMEDDGVYSEIIAIHDANRLAHPSNSMKEGLKILQQTH